MSGSENVSVLTVKLFALCSFRTGKSKKISAFYLANHTAVRFALHTQKEQRARAMPSGIVSVFRPSEEVPAVAHHVTRDRNLEVPAVARHVTRRPLLILSLSLSLNSKKSK